MKKLFVLFIASGLMLTGCSQKQENNLTEVQNKGSSETVTSTKATSLELNETDEIEIFTKAVSDLIITKEGFTSRRGKVFLLT